MIDSHCHLNDPVFAHGYENILKKAKESGIGAIVVPSENIGTSKRAVEMSLRYPEYIYPACGVHPHNAEDFNKEKIASLLESYKNVVAVGEIGLDFHYGKDKKEVQINVFVEQLKLATQYKLPVILHTRDAYEYMFEILKDFPDLQGVFHCFTAGPREAEKALSFDFYISYSGIITFKNADNVRNALKITPLNRMLVETDSPYLAPAPYRGKQNTPLYLPYVLKKVSEVKQISPEEADRITTQNARKLFGINQSFT